MEARRIGIEIEAHLGETERGHRAVEHEPHPWVIDLPVELDAECAVAGLLALPGELETAVVATEPAARDADHRSADHRVRKPDHARRIAHQPRVDARIAAGQAFEKRIVETTDDCLAGAGDDRAAPIRAWQHADLGLDIDDAQARDQVARQPAGQCDIIGSAHQIDAQRELALELVRGEREAFAGQRLRVDLEDARHRQIGEDAARDGADAGDALGLQRDRQRDRRPAPTAWALSKPVASNAKCGLASW